jgi:hypothetical protein
MACDDAEHYYSDELTLSLDDFCREKPKSESLVPSRQPDFAGMMRPGHDQSTPFGLSAAPKARILTQRRRAAEAQRGGAATKVAQTGSLLYRGLAIRNTFEVLAFRRLAVGDTAGCQPALRKWLAVHPR